MYKDTLKDSGAGDKSVEELQEDGDDEDAGDQETDQPPDLIDYQLVRDREPRTRTKPLRFQNESNMAAYAFAIAEEEDNHEPLTYQEAVACEDSSKHEGARGSKEDSWYGDRQGSESQDSEGVIIRDCPVRDYDVERMSKVPYANAVGRLMYLMVYTRPDIAYALSVVSKYLANMGKNHWEAVKWILKYLRWDWCMGQIGCAVSWKAMLQHVVALSTTEADYMALMEAMKEAIWLRRLLEELSVKLNTVAVNCDNQGAIHLSRNHVFHERTKHINVYYHFIREVLEAKTVEVLKVGTEHNAVDALT
ncbi:hypothetical protein Tco_0903563 [Tanacetum coccineum]